MSDSCHAKTPYYIECRNKCRVMDVRWGKNKWECHPISWSAIPQYYKNSSTPSSVHTTMHTVCQLVIGSSLHHKWLKNPPPPEQSISVLSVCPSVGHVIPVDISTTNNQLTYSMEQNSPREADSFPAGQKFSHFFGNCKFIYVGANRLSPS